MVVPLSVTSLTFIIIQPIVIGTWGTLTLIGAAAMLLQIPYAIDELLASLQFLRRRMRAGKDMLRVLFVGDTDESDRDVQPQSQQHSQSQLQSQSQSQPESQSQLQSQSQSRPKPESEPEPADEFDRSPGEVMRTMLVGGVSLPWNLALSALIAIWLLFTRLTFDSSGAMADADHTIGLLVLTTLSIAAAEPARAVRYLNVLFGTGLLVTPFVFEAGTAATVNSLVCGLALILLSRRRGAIRQQYGGWTRLIV